MTPVANQPNGSPQNIRRWLSIPSGQYPWTNANIVMPSIVQAMYETPAEARREQNRNAINSVSPPASKEQIHNASR